MDENWKPEVVASLISPLLEKVRQESRQAAAQYLRQVRRKKEKVSFPEFQSYVAQERRGLTQILQEKVWKDYVKKYGVTSDFFREMAWDQIEKLHGPTDDFLALIQEIESDERFQMLVRFAVVDAKRQALNHYKSWQPFDPIGKTLEAAAAIEKSRMQNEPERIIRDAALSRLESIIKAQANGVFQPYYRSLIARFGRLTEKERSPFLEKELDAVRNDPALIEFDMLMDATGKDLGTAVAISIRLDDELVRIWKEHERKAAAFVEAIPGLRKLRDGQALDLRHTFLKAELEARERQEKAALLPPIEPFDFGQKRWISNSELFEYLASYLASAAQTIARDFEKNLANRLEPRTLNERAKLVQSVRMELADDPLFHKYREMADEYAADPAGFVEKRFLETGQNVEDAAQPTPEWSESVWSEIVLELIAENPALTDFLQGWGKALQIEATLRQGRTNRKKQPDDLKEPAQPPTTLESALKHPDKIPEIFKRLAEMVPPFVDANGSIIGGKNARKHREVMALAQTLSKWSKVGQYDLYYILCAHIGLQKSTRLDKISNRPEYDKIWRTVFAEIQDLFK